ncbi:hypothetical protein KIN20_014508 [Parelaphostrongylus tenuis]|uniref:Uncharacterized protein n=1 Tax=Parelaphostrongylus tenuis TaxID=148309 RepID=A0AAD5MDR2_PARTN|nr:hypothetical protein KIN20_014508 [Parelaphostrongylus tenuis]
MREDLRSLLDTKSFSSSPVGEPQIRGLALLMVLCAREVYEGKLSGNSGCSWFGLDSPAEVMSHFEKNLPLNEVCWRLLGSSCDVSIEMLDFCTSKPNIVRFGSARNTIHWLRVSTSMAPQPLFYVPDD